jgi:prepilin-type N-terminal cleavage/methylation domain-containing protein
LNSLATIPTPQRPANSGRGFTYVEMMLALAIAALIIAGLSGVVGQALRSQDAVAESNRLTRDARFAMQRMVDSISRSSKLLLPQRDKPASNWPENLREQTVPPSPPVGDSKLASAVLAITLPADFDLDGNGIADADNDGDGLVDEDLPADVTNDRAAGIYLIDDSGDGLVDKFSACCYQDDDEDFGIVNEDPINGVDDDGDGLIDDDPGGDVNADACPGICGIDDDEDGSIDEGSSLDDDEDGANDEDWLDPMVFYLSGSTLKQRQPVPWDSDGDGDVDGRDFIESVIAENVTRFRVERLDNASTVDIVELTLELTSPLSGETVRLQTQVRVGGAL